MNTPKYKDGRLLTLQDIYWFAHLCKREETPATEEVRDVNRLIRKCQSYLMSNHLPIGAIA